LDETRRAEDGRNERPGRASASEPHGDGVRGRSPRIERRLTQALTRLVPKTAPSEDDRRQLNKGFGDALASAFELAFTPALFGLLGWRLDVWLGTEPLFLLLFVVIVFVYEVWKLYTQYARDLDRHQADLLGRRGYEGEST
jgi:F0F1-type ATP synthase assembly protein I